MIKTEHRICEGCRWNNYPFCSGTKMGNGHFMNIENLKENFQCGQKEITEITDFSFRSKTKLEELEDRIRALEEVRK